jgi:hypothetical protein
MDQVVVLDDQVLRPTAVTRLEDARSDESQGSLAPHQSATPPVTVVGDFADPLSFLASQRVTQIVSLGLLEVRWFAVESDRSRPMSGWPLDDAAARAVSGLSAAGSAYRRLA